MQTLAFGFNGWEVVLIAMVALLLFGRRLPEVGRSLGQGIAEFKKGLNEVTSDVPRVDADKKAIENKPGETPGTPAKP